MKSEASLIDSLVSFDACHVWLLTRMVAVDVALRIWTTATAVSRADRHKTYGKSISCLCLEMTIIVPSVPTGVPRCAGAAM